jgi:DNA primase
MISHFKLGYIPNEAITHISQDLLRDSGLYIYDRAVLGDRIAFPYIVDGKVTDIRGRTMDKNDPTRYKSPLGSATNRGAIYPYNFSDSTEEHIVTEGEIKAGIASQFGFKCVALPGIASWRMMTSTSTFKQTIVFDSARSKAGREHTLRAIDNISKKLYNPYVAMLPLGKEDKMDIDTFIMTKGTAEFRTIIDNALPYSEWAKIQRRVNVY